MVVGTLLFVQKGQTSGCSMQWTQYAVNAVHNGYSGIVVYCGGDIVFGTKIQWNSGILWW